MFVLLSCTDICASGAATSGSLMHNMLRVLLFSGSVAAFRLCSFASKCCVRLPLGAVRLIAIIAVRSLATLVVYAPLCAVSVAALVALLLVRFDIGRLLPHS